MGSAQTQIFISSICKSNYEIQNRNRSLAVFLARIIYLKIRKLPRAGNYGLKRTPRIFHWIFVDYCGIFQIIGILRNFIGLLEYFGIFWNIMEYYGLLWNIMEYFWIIGFFHVPGTPIEGSLLICIEYQASPF